MANYRHDWNRVSPDGRFLSFTDSKTGDVAIHDLATGQNRRLTDMGGWKVGFAEDSILSPDSMSIAYTWHESNHWYDLCVIGLKDSKPRVLRARGDGVVSQVPYGAGHFSNAASGWGCMAALRVFSRWQHCLLPQGV